MAEVLGIIAGVTGIADVAVRVSGRLHTVVKVWKNAPDEILALGREVSDFTAVMRSIEDACSSVRVAPSARLGLVTTLRCNIDRAAGLLHDIDDAIRELASMPRLKQRSKWLALRSSLKQKRKALHDLRVIIGQLLHAQGIFSNVRVELELVSIQTNLEHTSNAVADRMWGINQSLSQLSQRIAHMEGLVATSGSAIESKVDTMLSRSLHQLLTSQQQLERPCNTPAVEGDARHRQTPSWTDDRASGTFSIRTTYKSHRCLGSCICICHSRPSGRHHRAWKTPPLLRRLLGVLFAQYSGSPASTQVCDSIECQRNTSQTLELFYDFPLWCLNWGIHVLVQWGLTGSPTVSLTPRYRVSFRAGGLLHAVHSSNVALARVILQEMPYSVHFQAYNTGFTALHYACVKSDAASAEILRLLLRAGADFNVENDYGQSAGSIAASQILLGLMPSHLLTEMANWTSTSRLVDEMELSPVTEVALGLRLGNVDRMLHNLPPARLKLDEFDSIGKTPLYWAARAGNLSVVKALVGYGVDINIRTMSGKTPLIGACDSTLGPDTECFRWLLQNGGDPHRVDHHGFNALTSACCRRTLPAVRELLAWGMDVNTRDAMGRTGLGCAAQFNHDQIVNVLLNHNADTELENNTGWTPILDAVLNNSHECLQLLLKRGANYCFISRYGWSILHCSALAGDLRTMEILTEHRLRGVDALARSRVLGNPNAEGVFLRHRRRHPQAEILLAALRTLVATVYQATTEDQASDGENVDEGEEMYHDALEYL